MMLVKEVTSRQVDPVCVVKSGLQHDLATSWPQYCQLRREGMLGNLLLHMDMEDMDMVDMEERCGTICGKTEEVAW